MARHDESTERRHGPLHRHPDLGEDRRAGTTHPTRRGSPTPVDDGTTTCGETQSIPAYDLGLPHRLVRGRPHVRGADGVRGRPPRRRRARRPVGTPPARARSAALPSPRGAPPARTSPSPSPSRSRTGHIPPVPDGRGPEAAPSPSPLHRARSRRAARSRGWRKRVLSVTGGRVNLGPSTADRRRADLVARARTPVHGSHRRRRHQPQGRGRARPRPRPRWDRCSPTSAVTGSSPSTPTPTGAP